MMQSTLGPADFFRQLRHQQENCQKLVLWGDCLRVRLQQGVCCLPDAFLWLCEARKAGKWLGVLSLGAQGRRGTSLRPFFFLFKPQKKTEQRPPVLLLFSLARPGKDLSRLFLCHRLAATPALRRRRNSRPLGLALTETT